MVGGLIQQEKVRLREQKPDHGNLSLLTAGELGQLLFLIFFLKSESRKDPVIFLLPGKAFPIPFIWTGTGLQELFFHCRGGIRKSLLAEQANGQLAGGHDSGRLAFIIPVKTELSGQQPEQRRLSTAVLSHHGNLFISTYFKIKMRQNHLGSGT